MCNHNEEQFLETMLNQYTEMLNAQDELIALKERIKKGESLSKKDVKTLMDLVHSAIVELNEDLDAIEQEGLF